MLEQFIALLAVHWLADFVLQSHWQASNKSKRMDALLRHVGTYTAVLFVALPLIAPRAGYQAWIIFCATNGALHLATDYFTSRWTSALWAKQQTHNFFVVVGLDQLIHQVTLYGTLVWILA